MNCKKCNRQFTKGEVMYENSGDSPLCYPCAEKGSLQAAGILITIFGSCILIVLAITRLAGNS